MKRVLLALLAGFLFAAPVIAQVSGFNQRGKVTQEMQADGFTIAHPSLPINSKVMVVNTLTGREIEATVIRRITASANRIADISPSAWIELGLNSNTEVRIYTRPTAAQPSAPPPVQPVAPPPAEPVPAQAAPVSENPETVEQLNRLLEIMMEREAREAKEREEARIAKEEREARDREEAARIAKEEREAREREEAERIVREAREEADRITREAREEAERMVKELREAREREAKEIENARVAREAAYAREAREREEAERLAREREESARIAREREESSRLAREMAIARELEEAERLAKEREEAARLAREAREAREREEAERAAREREEAARIAREREEASRIAREAANAVPPQAANPAPAPTANAAPPPASEPPGRISFQDQPLEIKIIPNLPDPGNGKVYNIQLGAFSRPETAMDVVAKARNAGFDAIQEFTGVLYRVIVKDIPSSMASFAAQRLAAIGIKEIWIRER